MEACTRARTAGPVRAATSSRREQDLSSLLSSSISPAYAVDVGNGSRRDRRLEVGQEEAVALVRLHAHEPGWDPRRTECDVDVDDLAVEQQRLVVDQDVEVGAGRERLGERASRHRQHLGLPAVFEAHDVADVEALAVTQKLQARVAEVAQQAQTAPTLIEPEVERVVLARWRQPVVDRGPMPTEKRLCTLRAA